MSTDGEGLLARPAVRRVREALQQAGLDNRVVALDQTARSAQDAATAIGCALGQIVKSLVFRHRERAVLALVAGDRQGVPAAIAAALGLEGKLARADADFVKQQTGFSIGGVAPLGHVVPVRVAMDDSLWRFDTVHAAAGHPHCVFPAAPDELARLAGAVRATGIGVEA